MHAHSNNTSSNSSNSSSSSHPSHSHSLGVVVFRPLEAKLLPHKDKTLDVNAYCHIKIGHQHGHTKVDYSGLNPTWYDAVVIKRNHEEKFAKISVKNDHKRNSVHHKLGKAYIDLSEVVAQGVNSPQWYQLKKGNKVYGDILVSAVYVQMTV